MAIHVSECVLLSHQISITRLIPPSGWTGTITGKMKSMPGLRTRYMVERKKWNLTRSTNEPRVPTTFCYETSADWSGPTTS
jgi:hypothetical protein